MRYENLIVWQKSMNLVDRVYDLVDKFPKAERFALSNQLTRAVVSIPSNIAEGAGRASPAEFKKFLAIARGSLYEVNTQVKIAARRHYCENDQNLQNLIDELARMLTSMLRR